MYSPSATFSYVPPLSLEAWVSVTFVIGLVAIRVV